MPDGTLNGEALEGACFHCGLPLPADGRPRWRVEIAGVSRDMCCPGCAAVAETIVALGQGAYYRERSAYAARGDAAALPPALALYDNADPRFGVDADACSATLTVEGIRCAACVWLIERRLLELPGVLAASLNVATERLQLRWERERLTLAQVLAALHAIGYTAYPYDAGRHGEQLRLSARTLGRQLFVAGLAMMQVMMYVAPAYLADAGTLDESMAGLMRWASLLLTLPAVCYSAQPFFGGALASLRARALNMDVPVALGIAAAFGASVVATFQGVGEVYFDSVTMFIFLLLCSRYLELRARRQAAGALQRLQHALPASANRLAGFPASRAATLVSAAALNADDVILIKPGEAAAADCRVIEGCSGFDLSLLTGESAPRLCMVGEEVQGGAINIGSPLLARVLRPSADSTLADLVRLVEQAGRQKPRIAEWSDRIAAWFVAALLLFALACLLYWWWHDAARAWPIAIAVLVVSCPCALSLATPSALAAATDSLLRRGVLVVGPQTLETLRRASHIIFDKTGTLTEGRPTLQRVQTLGELDAATCLRIAAALEAGSLHPLGRAVTEAGAALSLKGVMTARDIREVAGQGLEGRVAGIPYRLGNAAFAAGLCGMPLRAAIPDGMGALYLADERGPLACLLLHDPLRADARATVDYFRAAGKKVLVLSGDDDTLTRRVAATLGITRARGGCLPADKLARVRQLQAEGAVVAMVGDGINDAAVLGAADVSFAMGAGAALAQAHADAVLLSGRLGSVADTARTAARTMAVIRQNLAWAMLYNALAIPAAALGLLNPWLSGAGMACSSAVVLLNALRLRRGP
ncbi:cadmium-translocating P-type ATPase [Oxalobacteraceae bacterium]|nr:cadmium-translocating P-type ATPase [Oxalobacteraceae bacterium]